MAEVKVLLGTAARPSLSTFTHSFQRVLMTLLVDLDTDGNEKSRKGVR